MDVVKQIEIQIYHVFPFNRRDKDGSKERRTRNIMYTVTPRDPSIQRHLLSANINIIGSRNRGY